MTGRAGRGVLTLQQACRQVQVDQQSDDLRPERIHFGVIRPGKSIERYGTPRLAHPTDLGLYGLSGRRSIGSSAARTLIRSLRL